MLRTLKAHAPQACVWHIHTALVEWINLSLRQRVAVLGRRRATPYTGTACGSR